jgi:hypothetical protein
LPISGAALPEIPYSITFETTLVLDSSSTGTSFDIELLGGDSQNGGFGEVPEPSVLLLLGLGIAWTGISKKIKF